MYDGKLKISFQFANFTNAFRSTFYFVKPNGAQLSLTHQNTELIFQLLCIQNCQNKSSKELFVKLCFFETIVKFGIVCFSFEENESFFLENNF